MVLVRSRRRSNDLTSVLSDIFRSLRLSDFKLRSMSSPLFNTTKINERTYGRTIVFGFQSVPHNFKNSFVILTQSPSLSILFRRHCFK